MTIQEEIKMLTEELNKYSDAYYNDSTSLISDKEYDLMYDRLKSLENKIGILSDNSPTKNVGFKPKSKLQKVRHSHKMLSLDKTKDVSQLMKFAGNHECVLTCKMDGLTMLLTYDKGHLVKAETRGDGEVGEDVTHTAYVFDNIPKRIHEPGLVEVEGEAIITYEDFEKINSTIKNDDDKYKNPRNLASGSVRQLDANVARDRHLKFITWKMPEGFKTFTDGFIYAEDYFDVVPWEIIPANSSRAYFEDAIQRFKDTAKRLSYPIDGLVISYNDVEYGQSLGMTGHHPLHSLAFKFGDEAYETRIIDVEWTIGKTGQLTPTAIFEPVEIDGTIVERASLHNVSLFKERELHYGDTITVSKRNMIIPYVEDNITRGWNDDEGHEFSIPTTCTYCNSPTEVIKDNDTEVLICTNSHCSGTNLKLFQTFVSRDGVNIDGISEATLKFIIDRGWVAEYADFYNGKLEDHRKVWQAASGYGKKSVDKIFEAIENSRNTDLQHFITALSIPGIGPTMAKSIAKYCKQNPDEFFNFLYIARYATAKIDNFGDALKQNVQKFVRDFDQNQMFLLIEQFNFKKEETSNEAQSLQGKTFVVTGSVEKFKNRKELQEKIESLGGKVAGSVSKNTDYLLNNDTESSSSKNKKAKELGIPIISEDEFLKMIG